VELGHRRLAGEGTSKAAQPRRVVGEQARRLEPGGHVREQEVVALFAAALSQKGAGLVNRRLSDAERLP
jgi:hypothetical protein